MIERWSFGRNLLISISLLAALVTTKAVSAAPGTWGEIVPDSSWVPKPSPTSLPGSQYFESNQGLHVYVAAPELPTGVEATEVREPTMAALVGRLAGADPILESKDAREVGGQVGIIYTYTAGSSAVAAWVGHTDTQLFQLLVWGPNDRSSEIDAAFAEFCQQAALPERKNPFIQGLSDDDFENTAMGFRVDQGDGSWSKFPVARDPGDLAFAAVRLMRGGSSSPGALVIRASRLGGRHVPVEIAYEAFAVASVTLPPLAAGWEKTTEGEYEIQRFIDKTDYNGGTVSLGAEVRVGNDVAYLVVVTSVSADQEGLESVRKDLESIEYFAPEDPNPSPHAGNGPFLLQRRRHLSGGRTGEQGASLDRVGLHPASERTNDLCQPHYDVHRAGPLATRCRTDR